MRRMLTVWFAWIVLMAGANLATPLYAVYSRQFGFSPLVLTAIFATYAIVLVPALVFFGRLSDRFGRRPQELAHDDVLLGGRQQPQRRAVELAGRVAPDQAVGEGVHGRAHGRPRRAPEAGRHPVAQLLGGLAGEGQGHRLHHNAGSVARP